jgi:hypothetical protein
MEQHTEKSAKNSKKHFSGLGGLKALMRQFLRIRQVNSAHCPDRRKIGPFTCHARGQENR